MLFPTHPLTHSHEIVLMTYVGGGGEQKIEQRRLKDGAEPDGSQKGTADARSFWSLCELLSPFAAKYFLRSARLVLGSQAAEVLLLQGALYA